MNGHRVAAVLCLIKTLAYGEGNSRRRPTLVSPTLHARQRLTLSEWPTGRYTANYATLVSEVECQKNLAYS
jgi:hypothetical protein